MDEQEELRRRQHWNELAEVLGLDPNAEPEAAAPSAPREAPPSPVSRLSPVPAKVVLQTAEPSPIDDEFSFSKAPPVERMAEKRVEQVKPPPKVETFAEPTEPIAEAPPPVAEVEERRPPRGRGRGGRPEPRRREVEPDSEPRFGEGVDTGALASDEPVSGEELTEGRRRRGRGRRRKEEEPREESPVALEADEQEARPVAGAMDDEDSDVSGWVVPAWNDLIASLYRPER